MKSGDSERAVSGQSTPSSIAGRFFCRAAVLAAALAVTTPSHAGEEVSVSISSPQVDEIVVDTLLIVAHPISTFDIFGNTGEAQRSLRYVPEFFSFPKLTLESITRVDIASPILRIAFRCEDLDGEPCQSVRARVGFSLGGPPPRPILAEGVSEIDTEVDLSLFEGHRLSLLYEAWARSGARAKLAAAVRRDVHQSRPGCPAPALAAAMRERPAPRTRRTPTRAPGRA